MQIVIKKAAIKGSLFLSYEFEQTDVDVKNLIKTSSDAPIHDDLRQCFRKLIPHFAFICVEVKDEILTEIAIAHPDSFLCVEVVDPSSVVFKYRVFCFSIVDKDGEEIITLHGSKSLETYKEISFSTPGTSLLDDEYKFQKELVE